MKVLIELSNLSLGESLKLLRTRRGVTLRELANHSITSASTLSRFERGKQNIPLSTVQAAFLSLGYELEVKLTPKK